MGSVVQGGKAMTRIESSEAEREAIVTVATLMAASARTAPKTRGVDMTNTVVVDRDDIATLAAAMEEASTTKVASVAPIFIRDAESVRNSKCVVLFGVSGVPKRLDRPFNCGACGFSTCEGLLKARVRKGDDFCGPVCAFQAIDLGVALASAAKVASDLNIDNRIMYTAGVAATKLGWMEADIIVGIPLSTTGKNPYFDRDWH